jgi:Protein of unknown function (DUF3307)
MNWASVSIVFFASHLTGDFLLQTDWQARHKAGGLGADPVARRALLSHVSTYTLAFVPALIWIGSEVPLPGVLAIAALIFLGHLVVDDGRLLALYMRRVKSSFEPSPQLAMAVDQSVHLICLWGTALLVGPLS